MITSIGGLSSCYLQKARNKIRVQDQEKAQVCFYFKSVLTTYLSEIGEEIYLSEKYRSVVIEGKYLFI